MLRTGTQCRWDRKRGEMEFAMTNFRESVFME